VCAATEKPREGSVVLMSAIVELLVFNALSTKICKERTFYRLRYAVIFA